MPILLLRKLPTADRIAMLLIRCVGCYYFLVLVLVFDRLKGVPNTVIPR